MEHCLESKQSTLLIFSISMPIALPMPKQDPLPMVSSVYWYSGSSKLVIHSNNSVLSTGTWSYITVTYDCQPSQANRFTIYVNGTDVTNRGDVVSAGTLAAIDPTNIRIGSDQPWG